MKTLKWFKEGESIPDNAKFIKHEKVIVGYKDVQVQDYAGAGQYSYITEKEPVYGERFLYEVGVEN